MSAAAVSNSSRTERAYTSLEGIKIDHTHHLFSLGQQLLQKEYLSLSQNLDLTRNNMKLFTALTLIYATLAAAAPSHLLLRDNKPPPPMMPVYISGLPSDNDDSNMKCGMSSQIQQFKFHHSSL